MFHGNVRFFVRGGNDLKKKARKLPPGEKRIHSQEYKSRKSSQPILNCTPFVRQYGILDNKWGDLLCRKEYQTRDTRQNSSNW